MRGIALRVGLTAVAATTMLTVPLAVPAGAGGGCHKPLTEGRGDTVAMAEACFTPSILRVDPGAEVRFVNKDAITHNVSSNGWGSFEDMSQSDDFRATFSQPGVYPFACTYHPGMVGALVVGAGTTAGSGSSVMGASTVTQATTDASDDAKAGAASTSADAGTSPTGWVAGGILGLAIGGGLGLAWRRRGRAGNESS